MGKGLRGTDEGLSLCWAHTDTSKTDAFLCHLFVVEANEIVHNGMAAFVCYA